MKVSTEKVKMTRQFDAAPKVLFEAWTNPELMKKWLFTSEQTNILAKSDARVNGTWKIIDRREGEDFLITGDYVELNRYEKLIMTLELPQFTDVVHSIVMEFKPAESGCEMTLTQSVIIPHEKRQTEKKIANGEEAYKTLSEQLWHSLLQELKTVVEQGNSDNSTGIF